MEEAQLPYKHKQWEGKGRWQHTIYNVYKNTKTARGRKQLVCRGCVFEKGEDMAKQAT
jgi:hypothetical protein